MMSRGGVSRAQEARYLQNYTNDIKDANLRKYLVPVEYFNINLDNQTNQ